MWVVGLSLDLTTWLSQSIISGFRFSLYSFIKEICFSRVSIICFCSSKRLAYSTYSCDCCLSCFWIRDLRARLFINFEVFSFYFVMGSVSPTRLKWANIAFFSKVQPVSMTTGSFILLLVNGHIYSSGIHAYCIDKDFTWLYRIYW